GRRERNGRRGLNAALLKGRRNRRLPFSCPSFRVPACPAGCIRPGAMASGEDALALLVDDLLALAQRHVDRVVEAGEAVGADEAVLLQHAVDLLRDDAAGLVLPVVLVGRRGDREALVLDL